MSKNTICAKCKEIIKPNIQESCFCQELDLTKKKIKILVDDFKLDNMIAISWQSLPFVTLYKSVKSLYFQHYKTNEVIK